MSKILVVDAETGQEIVRELSELEQTVLADLFAQFPSVEA